MVKKREDESEGAVDDVYATPAPAADGSSAAAGVHSLVVASTSGASLGVAARHQAASRMRSYLKELLDAPAPHLWLLCPLAVSGTLGLNMRALLGMGSGEEQLSLGCFLHLRQRRSLWLQE